MCVRERGVEGERGGKSLGERECKDGQGEELR